MKTVHASPSMKVEVLDYFFVLFHLGGGVGLMLDLHNLLSFFDTKRLTRGRPKITFRPDGGGGRRFCYILLRLHLGGGGIL